MMGQTCDPAQNVRQPQRPCPQQGRTTRVACRIASPIRRRFADAPFIVPRLSRAAFYGAPQSMLTLFHHPFCPHSRFVRLVLEELGLPVRLVEERVWERREEFLTLNPAGTTPVLVEEGAPPVPGAGVIAEYLDETHAAATVPPVRLLPSEIADRVEVRRLMSWFNDKLFAEASGPLVTERVYKRHIPEERGGGPPDTEIMRAARSNIKYHLGYIGWLVRRRELARGRPVDLCRPERGGASVRHRLSGRRAVERKTRPTKAWYARIKSRPSFRTLLGETLPGLAPAPTTPISTSDASRGQERARRSGPRARLRRLRRHPTRRHSARSHRAPRIPRSRQPWRHGLDGAPCRPPRRPADDPLAILNERLHGAISVYALGDDTHDLIKPRLKALARMLVEKAGGDVKVFVDTAPVMEKPLAQAAGLGWQGKHTNSAFARAWLVAVPRRDFQHARAAARSGRGGPLRLVSRVPRCLSDGGVSRALPARCKALHLLSHDRAQRPDPACTAAKDR